MRKSKLTRDPRKEQQLESEGL